MSHLVGKQPCPAAGSILLIEPRPPPSLQAGYDRRNVYQPME